MNGVSIDNLILTPEERSCARDQVQKMAYLKWQAAGCPDNSEKQFWEEAELEWTEYYYVPDRNCDGYIAD